MNTIGLTFLTLFLSIGCSGSYNKAESVSATEEIFSNKKDSILTLLHAIRGKHILGGIHNREPNSDPARWTNEIFKLTGDYPALWSGDFLFQKENIEHRGTMIQEAIKQYRRGAVVNIMWHACNPANSEPCEWDNGQGVLSQMNDEQWKELFVKGSDIHSQFMKRADDVAVYLKTLKDSNVVVLFRPFHEMNQGKFWWGGRKGAEGTVKLYQMLHDYFSKEKALSNLIWVWNIQDFPTLDTDADDYNPGDAYWDIVCLDVYDDQSGFSNEKYETIRRVSNGKPMGIGECQKLPSLEVLNAQRDWVFFMSWSELTFEHNSKETIKEIFTSDKVYTVSELNS